MLRTKIEEFNRQVKLDEASSDFEDDDGGAKSLVRVMPVIKIKSDEASSDFEDDDGGAKSLVRVMPVIKKKKKKKKNKKKKRLLKIAQSISIVSVQNTKIEDENKRVIIFIYL